VDGKKKAGDGERGVASRRGKEGRDIGLFCLGGSPFVSVEILLRVGSLLDSQRGEW